MRGCKPWKQLSGSEGFLGLKSFILSIKDLLSLDDDRRYTINETDFRMQPINIERFCTFPLVAEASMPREDLTINLTVDSSSKYQHPHLPLHPCGLRR